jgi:hypothetical protein
MSSTVAPDWLLTPQARPGSEAFQQDRHRHGGEWDSKSAPDNGASSVMLPIRRTDGEWGYSNGSVLVAGGAADTPFARAVDIFDPVTWSWHPTIDAGVARHDPSTVLLPDGRVLIVGGIGSSSDVRHAAYVDPTDGMAYSLGATDSGQIRGYHNIALLLPNGSVLVGGGRGLDTDATFEKPTIRFYYPHYMFVPRPVISATRARLTYGDPFTIDVDTSRVPSELVLMGLGAMTHSFDADQRSIQLRLRSVSLVGQDRYRAVGVGPAGGRVAPPGYYMLFVLDDQRIPSPARIVWVGP